jgi:hypothetical protein
MLKKPLLTAIIACLCFVGLVHTTAFAANAPNGQISQQNQHWSIVSGITIYLGYGNGKVSWECITSCNYDVDDIYVTYTLYQKSGSNYDPVPGGTWSNSSSNFFSLDGSGSISAPKGTYKLIVNIVATSGNEVEYVSDYHVETFL